MIVAVHVVIAYVAYAEKMRNLGMGMEDIYKGFKNGILRAAVITKVGINRKVGTFPILYENFYINLFLEYNF